ncbi:hypothetical protein GLOTRDRAFT_132101 [Gloeophyllum trabeum ATCC 11539]|uniref:Cleavage/polyadenylation specificity factor A subunit N-terminal domain-containing protein n=1 Tax=Gloeophyllum trabeum (strain ATCC 11539 / FP-39264 / Madison 617) TaxID=670483 RepID=S7RJQ2_GLOTA|nr:uncharacterized protein GLOTRDRAFT_132101 [Gloeophyllum trabeum ATCC 11539]EPQ52869.1 hypothetical protein GLOTRDRAFT_132101 [Gloeophyllum trabeum ATCC 11539]
MEEALDVVPVPQIYKALPTLSMEDVKWQTMRSSRLEKLWRRPDHSPKSVRDLHAPDDAQYLKLLPGGDWLAIIASDATVHLQHVTESDPRVSQKGVGTHLRELCCEISHTQDFDLLLLITGKSVVRGISHLLLYRIDTEIACMDLLVERQLHTSILAASASFNLLAFATGCEDMEIVHIQKIHGSGEQRYRELLWNVGITSSFQDSTLSIITPSQILICCDLGFSLYDVPSSDMVQFENMQDSDTLVEDGSAQDGDGPRVISVEPSWFLKYGLILCPPVVVPIPWNPADLEDSKVAFVLDYHIFHVLNLSSTSPSHRATSLPVKDCGDLTSIGTHRGVWWNEDKCAADPQLLKLRTCTLPRVPTSQRCLEDYTEEEFSVQVGSLLVPWKDKQDLEFVTMDEWSGRVCLLLKSDGPSRRIVMVDA